MVSSWVDVLSPVNFGMLTFSICRRLRVKPTCRDGTDYLECYLGCAGVPPQHEVTLEFVVWSENKLDSISESVDAH